MSFEDGRANDDNHKEHEVIPSPQYLIDRANYQRAAQRLAEQEDIYDTQTDGEYCVRIIAQNPLDGRHALARTVMRYGANVFFARGMQAEQGSSDAAYHLNAVDAYEADMVSILIDEVERKTSLAAIALQKINAHAHIHPSQPQMEREPALILNISDRSLPYLHGVRPKDLQQLGRSTFMSSLLLDDFIASGPYALRKVQLLTIYQRLHDEYRGSTHLDGLLAEIDGRATTLDEQPARGMNGGRPFSAEEIYGLAETVVDDALHRHPRIAAALAARRKNR